MLREQRITELTPPTSWPSWPAKAPWGRNQTGVMRNHGLHSTPLVLAPLWARHYRAVLPGHSNNFGTESCWGTAIGMHIVPFLCRMTRCNNCKIIPLAEEIVCKYCPKADLNQTKHNEAKFLTGLSEVLQMQQHSTTACSHRNSKGYSLYRRQVSLIPVEIPFPKGTSTPPRVVVAVGSGAVLPKPRKGK